MKTKELNLFIVDDDKLFAMDLKNYLQTKFGELINITTFKNGQSCLKKIEEDTHIVILDYFIDGKNSLKTLRAIKAINSETEVIMLSNNENMALAIETFRAGAKDYLIKGQGSWRKITKVINHILLAPIRVIVREFGVSKFAAIFLTTFVTMGIVVFIVMRLMK